MYTTNLPRSFPNNSLFTFPSTHNLLFFCRFSKKKKKKKLFFCHLILTKPFILLFFLSQISVSLAPHSLFFLFFLLYSSTCSSNFFFPSPKKLFFSSYAFFYFFFSPCHLLCFIPFFFLFLFWNNKFAFQLVLTKTNQYAQNRPKLYLRWTQNDIHNIGI